MDGKCSSRNLKKRNFTYFTLPIWQRQPRHISRALSLSSKKEPLPMGNSTVLQHNDNPGEVPKGARIKWKKKMHKVKTLNSRAFGGT